MEHTKFNEFVRSPDNPLFQSPDDDSLLAAAAASGASTEPRARQNLTFNSPPTTEEQPLPATTMTMSQMMATMASVAEATKALQNQVTDQQLRAAEQHHMMMWCSSNKP